MPRTKRTSNKSGKASKNATSDSKGDDKPKQVRQQLASVIGVTVSTARTRNMLTDMGINADVRAALAELDEAKDFATLSDATVQYALDAYADVNKPEANVTAVYKAFKANTTKARSKLDVEATKKVLANLVSRHLIRAGDDSVCALAATANWILTKLSEHGVETLASESKKTLKTRHIANDEISQLSVWPFLRTLPCVQAERDAYHAYLEDVERKKVEKKEKDKAKKAAAKAAAKAGEEPPTKGKKGNAKKEEKEATKPKEDEKTASSDDDADEKNEKKPRQKAPSDSFKHHAYNIARAIVKEKVDGDVSNDVRRFGSNVVYELIQRYVKLIRLQIAFANVKTIKANTITTINNLILTDAGVEDADFNTYIEERLQKYSEHAEAVKKAAKEKELAKKSSK